VVRVTSRGEVAGHTAKSCRCRDRPLWCGSMAALAKALMEDCRFLLSREPGAGATCSLATTPPGAYMETGAGTRPPCMDTTAATAAPALQAGP
jgi:hypothetical protein